MEIQYLLAGWVVIQGVGGKVTAQGVVYDGAKHVVTYDAAGVTDFGVALGFQVAAAKGRYLYGFVTK